jgi:hypothetical protein
MPNECGATTLGYCDHYQTRNWDHTCQEDDEHDAPHECGCGHRWTEPDQ